MMFSSVGALADRANWSFSDELVVVGRVPMNARNGKRQLRRIAQENTTRADRTSNKYVSGQTTNKVTEPKPAYKSTKPTPNKVSKPIKEPKEVKPKEVKPKEVKRAKEWQGVTERRTKPRECKPSGPALPVALVALPLEIIAHVVGFDSLRGLGRLAATSRACHANLWAGDSQALWSQLSLGFCTSLSSRPWNSFRLWRFQLDGDFLRVLAGLEPLAGLERGLELAQSLSREEQPHLRRFVQLLSSFANTCTDATKALGLLERITARMDLSPEVWGKLSLWECKGQLRERVILERLERDAEQEYETMTFDYFAPPADERPQMPALEESNFWTELEALEAKPCKDDLFFDDEMEEVEPERVIPEAESRALAVEFLECMGLHHGTPMQETLAAMEAMQ